LTQKQELTLLFPFVFAMCKQSNIHLFIYGIVVLQIYPFRHWHFVTSFSWNVKELYKALEQSLTHFGGVNVIFYTKLVLHTQIDELKLRKALISNAQFIEHKFGYFIVDQLYPLSQTHYSVLTLESPVQF
jgi:hypothetical protein